MGAVAHSIFNYREYKKYLNETISRRPRGGRGVRSEMAAALGCKTAYISQVLGGPANLSLEQADFLNRYLAHSREESAFLLLLVQHERAGTPSLRTYFHEQIEATVARRLVLKDRLDVKKTLDRSDQAIYYSAWYYSAVHVLLTLPGMRDRDSIARHLGLPAEMVGQVIDFLVSVGLATVGDDGLRVGTTRIHLESDSPMISKHHSNWRIQAIRALESATRKRDHDLHYSSVISISEADRVRIKSLLVSEIERIKEVVRTSPEEGLHCLSLDFFELP
jgi:uncharacterized protein (TIGR02147 family)